MGFIKKIRLYNFKRFEFLEVDFDEKINILIGDNEAGKSTILLAIDLVSSGSRNKVEMIGLEYLFNNKVIADFLNSEKKIKDLPELKIELYLNEQNKEETKGKNNTIGNNCDGLRLICKPNDEYSQYIKQTLDKPDCVFPFEYYSISFTTFNDIAYTNYNKILKHIFIDNSQMSSEYAMKEYVKDIFNSSVNDLVEKHQLQHDYRDFKEKFKKESLSNLNKRLNAEYNFAIKSNSKSNIETDITIFEGDISIDSKGKGRQCFIKTSLALSRSGKGLDIILLEEPENHLSHGNMKQLLKKINDTNDKQLFIATHSTLISTRLDLRKSIMLNSSSKERLLLKDLPEDTAKFFIKAPDNNILEFVLSKKVILVEGDAEYILIDAMFYKETGQTLEDAEIHIISVDGTSFKRYLDIAKILSIKTAVITDNDKKYQENCIQRYSEYNYDFIKICAEENIDRYTFEVCIYEDNKTICDDLFGKRKTLSVIDFMLQNKAEVAYLLMDKKANEINVPNYIKDAFLWIRN